MQAISPTVFGFALLFFGTVILVAIFWIAFWAVAKILPVTLSIAGSAARGAGENPNVTGFAQRHPRLTAIIRGRLDTRSFYGLFLTILGGTFLYFLVLYASSLVDFALSDNTLGVDGSLANLFYAYRDPELVEAFTLITIFGYANVVLAIAVGVSAILLLRKQPYFVYGLWFSLIGSTGMVWALKLLFARPRSDLGVYFEASNSFPSGHATVSVAFYGFLAYIAVRNKTPRPLLIIVLAVVLALLIGASRIYLVEHYLSDVLNGYLSGAIWLLLAITLVEWRQHLAPKNLHVVIEKWKVWTIVAIVAVDAAAVAGLIATYHQPLRSHVKPDVVQLDTSIQTAFSDGALSPFTATVFGTKMEPASLVILAPNDVALVNAFAKSGWTRADKLGFTSFSEAIYAAWFNGEYLAAPVTPSFWMDAPNDFGFQKSTLSNSLRQRHHARFWKTGFKTRDGLLIYVGTASFDDGLKWGITHHIDPNIDKERAQLVADLSASGATMQQDIFQLIPANLGQNFAGDPFFTDGKSIVLKVR